MRNTLITATTQGGAVNRIIDVEMADGYIFDNGNEIVELLKSNYGHAGLEFVELVQEMNNEELQEIQKDFYSKIVDRAKNKDLKKKKNKYCQCLFYLQQII